MCHVHAMSVVSSVEWKKNNLIIDSVPCNPLGSIQILGDVKN